MRISIRALLAAAVLATSVAQAQENVPKNFDSLTMEDLLNMSTAVSTKTEMPTRAAPGIVTVITEDEIRQSGARDMIDVLMLVPGFGFGNDTFNAASVGIRGIWANEGKVLVLVDGMEINEILFSTIQFGNRFPVDQIKRVEIIRGPGSAIYGGFAELGVLNIITKSGAALNGCEVTGKYGQMEKINARSTISAACGLVKDGVNMSAAIYSGEGERSDREFTEFDTGTNATQTSDFAGNELNPFFVNVGVSSDRFSFRYIREDYAAHTTTGFGYLNIDAPRPVYSNFWGQYLGLDLHFKPMEKLEVTPYITWKKQQPWQSTDVELAKAAGGLVSNFIAQRMVAGVRAGYDLTSNSNLLVGYERIMDSARNENFNAANGNYQATFWDGGIEKGFYTNSAYAQYLTDLGFAKLTAGARYDSHNQAGDSFVPRLGLTRADANWHAKILASNAFRAPTIIDVDTNPDIKPDKTTALEVEGGYKVSEKSYLTLNLFHMKIEDKIGWNPATFAKYNEDRIATYGVEAEYKLKDTWGYAAVGYSYYRPEGDIPDSAKVEDKDDILLGFPNHKITVSSVINLGHSLKLSPTIIYMTEYYGTNWNDSTNTTYAEKLEPDPLANLFLNYENAFWQNFDLGFGVYNILNSDWRLAQPYFSGTPHAPMPTGTREFMLRADYALAF